MRIAAVIRACCFLNYPVSKAALPSFRLKSVVFRPARASFPRTPERLPFSTANRSKNSTPFQSRRRRTERRRSSCVFAQGRRIVYVCPACLPSSYFQCENTVSQFVGRRLRLPPREAARSLLSASASFASAAAAMPRSLLMQLSQQGVADVVDGTRAVQFDICGLGIGGGQFFKRSGPRPECRWFRRNRYRGVC